MSIKDKLMNLISASDIIRIEAVSIVSSVKSKADDKADAQRASAFLSKKDYSWRTDVPIVLDLAERYKISVSSLKKAWTAYQEAETNLSSAKKQLEELGLRNIVVGTKGFGAVAKNNCGVVIYFSPAKKGIEVRVYPYDEEVGWNESFERYAYLMKKDIIDLLEK